MTVAEADEVLKANAIVSACKNDSRDAKARGGSVIVPNEYWAAAVQAGKKWLKDPATQILYVDENGCVLRKDDDIFSVRVSPHQITFTPRLNRILTARLLTEDEREAHIKSGESFHVPV